MKLSSFVIAIPVSLAALLLVWPVSVEPVFNNVQSYYAISEPFSFSLAFYAFAISSVLSSIYFAKDHLVLAFALATLYTFIFLNFWVLKSPLPLNSESPINMGLVKDVLSSGRVDLTLGYLQYPGLFLYAAAFTQMSGFPLVSAVVGIGLGRAVMFQLLILLISLKVLRSRRGAIVASLLAIQCDIMLSRMPAFNPEVFGLLFFLIAILFIVREPRSTARAFGFLMVICAGAVSYSLVLVFVSAVLAGILVARRVIRFQGFNFVSARILGATFILFASWSLLTVYLVFFYAASSNLTSLFSLPHYFNLIRYSSADAIQTPPWVGGALSASLILLFGIPLFMWIRKMTMRGPKGIEDICLPSLMIASFPLLAIPGGADIVRLLYYLAPFSSIVLIGWALRFSKANLILSGILVAILVLSFPSFIAYNVQVNFTSNHPQSLVAGEYVQNNIANSNQRIFTEAFLGNGITGLSGAFYSAHIDYSLDLYIYPTAESYGHALNLMALQFATTRGALLSVSPQVNVGADFNFGNKAMEPIWSSFTSSISDGFSQVYDNGITTLYSS